GTFSPGGGTVTFNGTSSQSINGTATSQTFNNVIVANSIGLSVSGSTTALTLNGNLTLASGSLFVPGSRVINIAGDWIDNGGSTFFFTGGTVTFNSTTAAQSIRGTPTSQTFNNVTVDKSGQTLSI